MDEFKPCPSCGSKAIRDDKTTKGVEGAVRCSECSFCALVTDWEAKREAEGVDFPILKIINKYLNRDGKIERRGDLICLIDKDGGHLAGGKTLKELMENCIWAFY